MTGWVREYTHNKHRANSVAAIIEQQVKRNRCGVGGMEAVASLDRRQWTAELDYPCFRPCPQI